MNIRDLTVEEFTSPLVVTINVEKSMDDAIALMQSHNIRHLPVVKDQLIVGIISERDVLTHVGKDWSKMLRVGDIMSTSILSVYVNDNLGEVAYMLSSQKKGSAIVLDTEGNFYGIFTTTDALNALVEIVYLPNVEEQRIEM